MSVFFLSYINTKYIMIVYLMMMVIEDGAIRKEESLKHGIIVINKNTIYIFICNKWNKIVLDWYLQYQKLILNMKEIF